MSASPLLSSSPRSRSVAAPLPAPAAATAATAVPADFQARAAEAAALLKALANADRLLLLCQMVGGERSVTELGVLAGIEQPTLSQQLSVLRHERLVATRRDGKSVFYRIAAPSTLAVLDTLYSLFCDGPAARTVGAKRAPTGRRARPRKEPA